MDVTVSSTPGHPQGTVLVANRGEIAVRIVRAAHSAGLRTVALFTADEADALHVAEADVGRRLAGTGPAAYLDGDDILAAARETGATLVHPGYGFLSESPEFSRACAEAGLVFVGPAAETLELFGDKAAARGLAERSGVPVLPATGSPVSVQQARDFFAGAGGGAVMVKAVAGGGGRGMRVVLEPGALEPALERCASEALRGFGRGDLFVERYLPRSRHIEVQLVGDGVDALHLGTRDCSLQRRHQKLIEIAPAPGLEPGVADRMTGAALALARAVGLRGLATVEFLLDIDHPEAFYFIEVNPRLQVEHGITELVTGTDIVRAQLAVAQGATLAETGLLAARERAADGIAIEARVTTVVSAGAGGGHGVGHGVGSVITRFDPPEGAGIRVDTGGFAGLVVGSLFDPLLAKVMVHETSGDLKTALDRTVAALRAFTIEGPGTNLSALIALLETLSNGVQLSTTLVDDLADADPAATATASPGSLVPLLAGMSGTVLSVPVQVGEQVQRGQTLVVVEAMKMEQEISAPGHGTVESLAVEPGQQVLLGHPVALLRLSGLGATAEADAIVDPEHLRADVAENRRRHGATEDAARAEAVARRHARGKRTARENIADLADDGRLVEYGSLVIAAQRRRRSVDDLEANTPADGLVAGFVRVGGREVVALAYDYTVLAGTQGLQSHRKAERMFDLALRQNTPVVVFAEGGGGRPGDTDNQAKATGMDLGTFVALGRLNGRVPTVAIASGRCFAGNAAIVGASDLAIATEDANIGMGGPAMIEGGGLGRVDASTIGPAAMQYGIGVVDVLVADEAAATAAAKTYLGFFRGRHTDWEEHDQRLLRSIVPGRRSRPFDIRRVIGLLADVGSALELRGGFAPGMVTTLATIEGWPVGIVANDGRHLGGAIDSDGAGKMARFLGLCDNYGIPVVTLTDTPGFMVGPESETTGAVRHFGRLFTVGPNLSVPLVNVILRKSYGLGGQAMAGGGFRVPTAIVAWPTGELGAMGPEGAVRL
ncbi:MAG: hypothetical protein JWR01_2677, partial [Subtercola sp.]|nr:hypothetical protein [Subtercola sp.]